jgi:GcrA cell cycle regulator
MMFTMVKTPFDLNFAELIAAGERASAAAREEARRAGVAPALLATSGAQPVSPPAVEDSVTLVLTLGAHTCKWPMGDPASENFTFCGRRVTDESPYCVEHSRLAYQLPAAAVNDLSIEVRSRKSA